MALPEAKICKGDYVVAIVKGTDGEVKEGVVLEVGTETLQLRAPDGVFTCNRKFVQLSLVPMQQKAFVRQVLKSL